MTESLVQLIGVTRHKSDLVIAGIGGKVSQRSRGMVQLQLESRVSPFQITPQLYIFHGSAATNPRIIASMIGDISGSTN